MADERTSKARLAELSAALEAERELRRRAEQALRESEEATRATQEFLTGLLEHAPTPIYATGSTAAVSWSTGPGRSCGGCRARR